MRRGQASSEYIIILAVVLILALVAVAVLGGFIDLGGEMDDDTSKAYWRTSGSTPEVGILNWELDEGGTFLAEIRNNADYNIRLEQFLVDGSDVLDGALTLPIGARQVICGETTAGAGTYALPARAVYKSLPYDIPKDFTGREPVVGRYVTEQLECQATALGVSCDDQVNLALNQPVTASSYYQVGSPTYMPANAVDCNLTTPWNSGGYAPAWFQIDLGEIKTFSTVSVWPSSSSGTVVVYDILGSTDDVSYDTIVSQSSADTSLALSDLESAFSVMWNPNEFSPVNYRYVKIDVTSWPGSWVSIHEIEVT